MKKIPVIITLILFAFALAEAQTRDPFFSRLQDDWVGEGTTLTMQAQIRSKWEWILEDKFFRLSLNYETKPVDKLPNRFSGNAYYQAKGAGVYEGQWFDSIGNQYPIKARLEGDSLIAFWGTAEKVEGKSVYRLINSDKELEITDFLKQKNGAWKEFNRFKLCRE